MDIIKIDKDYQHNEILVFYWGKIEPEELFSEVRKQYNIKGIILDIVNPSIYKNYQNYGIITLI